MKSKCAPTKKSIVDHSRQMILRAASNAAKDLETLRGRLKCVIYDALEYCGGEFMFHTTKKPKPFTHEQTIEYRKSNQTTSTFKAVLKRVYLVNDPKYVDGKHAKVEAWHIDGCWDDVGPFELDDFSVSSLEAIARHMAVFAQFANPKGLGK